MRREPLSAEGQQAEEIPKNIYSAPFSRTAVSSEVACA